MQNCDVDPELLAIINDLGAEKILTLNTASMHEKLPDVYAVLANQPLELIEAITAFTLRYLASRGKIDINRVRKLIRALELMESQVTRDMVGFGPVAKA